MEARFSVPVWIVGGRMVGNECCYDAWVTDAYVYQGHKARNLGMDE